MSKRILSLILSLVMTFSTVSVVSATETAVESLKNLVIGGDMETDEVPAGWKVSTSSSGSTLLIVDDDVSSEPNKVLRFDGTYNTGNISYISNSAVVKSGYFYSFKIRLATDDTNTGNVHLYTKINDQKPTEAHRPKLKKGEWVTVSGTADSDSRELTYKMINNVNSSSANVAKVIYEIDDVVICDMTDAIAFEPVISYDGATLNWVSGVVEIDGKTYVKEGSDISFKVTAPFGYEINTVKVNGNEIEAVDDRYTITAPAEGDPCSISVTKVEEAGIPHIVSFSPENCINMDPENAVVTVNFDREIDITTLTNANVAVQPYSSFTVEKAEEEYVYNLFFNGLSNGTEYTITFTTGITTDKPVALEEEYVYSFITAKSSTGMPLTNLIPQGDMEDEDATFSVKGTASFETEAALTGNENNKVLKIDGSSDTANVTRLNLKSLTPMTAGHTYYIDFDYKIILNSNIRVRNSEYKVAIASNNGYADQWYRLSKNCAASYSNIFTPAENTYYQDIIIGTGEKNTELYIDNLVFYDITDAVEIEFNTGDTANIVPVEGLQLVNGKLMANKGSVAKFAVKTKNADDVLSEVIVNGITLTPDAEGVYSFTVEESDNTIYITTKKLLTLIFNTNGGTPIEQIITDEETAIIDLEQYIPRKEGYIFEGWYSDSSLTNRISTITLTSDTTVYAKWIANAPSGGGGGGGLVIPMLDPYEIGVIPDKAVARQGDTINYRIVMGPVADMGSMQMRLVIPEGLAYVPDSGVLAEGLKETLGFADTRWTETTLMVNGYTECYDYESEANTEIATFQCTVDEDFCGEATVGLTYLEFYSFITWEDHTDRYTVVTTPVMVSEPVAENYTLTFNANGGSVIEPITAEDGTVINLEQYVPTKSGHNFDGWYSDSSLTNRISTITLTSDTIVYAKWIANSPSGGCGGGGPKPYGIYVIPDKTEAQQGDTINYRIVMGPVADMGSMQMRLVIPEGLSYEADSFRITNGLMEAMRYDILEWMEERQMLYGGASVGDYECDTETEIATFQCTAKEDFCGEATVGLTYLEFYSCITWEDHTERYSVLTTPVTVTKPVAESYTLTFNANGGTNVVPITAEEGMVIDLNDYVSTRSHFVFAGWYSDSSLTNRISAITLTSDTTVYAKWLQRFTVSFNTNGGIAVPTFFAIEGDEISLAPYVTTKEGFTFDGWYLDAELTNKTDSITLTSNTTVYAKWTANASPDDDEPAQGIYELKVTTDKPIVAAGNTATFTITLCSVADMGSMQMDLVIPEGFSYVPNSFTIAPGLMGKLGFDHIDWTEETLVFNGFASAADYKCEKPTVLATFVCKADENYTGFAEVALSYLEFYSCKTFEDHTALYYVTPAEIEVVEGFTLTFNTQDGSSFDSVTATPGDVINLANFVPTKSGYLFGGWYTDASFTNKVTSVTLDADTTVYAQWLVPYTITFEVGDEASGISPVIRGEGAEFNPSAFATSREGYDFMGWFLEDTYETQATAFTVTKDTTLYAKWQIQIYNIGVYTKTGNTAEGSVQFGEGEFTHSAKEQHPYKTEITLTAKPFHGYEFLRWDIRYSANGSIAGTSTQNPVSFTAKKDVYYYAIFKKLPTQQVSGGMTSYLDPDAKVSVTLFVEGYGDMVYREADFESNNTGFELPDIPAGTYTFVFSKPKHVPREYTITVGNEAFNQDIKLHPIGDFNGSGTVTTVDYTRANSHAQRKSPLEYGYEFKCLDVVGTDNRITTADAMRINSHARKVSFLW